MNLGYAVQVAAAAVLIVPTLALQQDGARGLEQALADTVRALESLAGIRGALESAPSADHALVAEIARATEPALAQGEERDSLLARLRVDVNRLQTEFDELAAPGTTAIPTGAPSAIGPDPEALPSASGITPRASGITTGLAPADKDRLSVISPPSKSGGPSSAAAASTATRPRTSLEAEGFTASPLHLGRAYYRAGRFEEALALLEPASAEPEAAYWRARCLEKLGRIDDALEGFRAVSALPGAGWLAERAKSDLDFLTWRRTFDARRKKEEPR